MRKKYKPSSEMKKALHSKKHKSVLEKPLCGYIHRYCTQRRLEGYLYCIRHILEDKNSPFRQCAYINQQNRKRCHNAAPKSDKRDSLCPRHFKQAQFSKGSALKKSESENFPNLLCQLEQYCQHANHSATYDSDEEFTEYHVSPASSEITDLRYLAPNNDGNKALLDHAWFGHSDESESDLDECEFEDPLRHAGVYTYEEVAKIYSDKLIQLQSLYMDQFKWLQYKLREKRRDYLHAIQSEKKTLSSIHNTPRLTSEEEIAYQNLKSMFRYHRRHGTEAVLHYKSLRKRQAKSKSSSLKHGKTQMCIFSTKSKRCNKKAIILSKFCFEHILFDSRQVLFKRCVECYRPIVPYGDNKACLLHSKCKMIVRRSKQKVIEKSPDTGPSETPSVESKAVNPDQEHFQSMDDIASLGLDAVVPGSLFGLNQFGEPGESTDSAVSDDRGNLIKIRPIGLNTPK